MAGNVNSGIPPELVAAIERATLIARAAVLEKTLEVLAELADPAVLEEVANSLNQWAFAQDVLVDLDRLGETS
jgi:hypothetical protein